MTDVCQASAALRQLAEPWSAGEKIKRLIERAAGKAGLSYWRAFDIWYRKARRIDAAEFDAIVIALAKKREEARDNDFHRLQIEVQRLTSMYAQRHPEFDRTSPDAIRDELRRMGDESRAVARSGDQAVVGRKSR